MRATGDTFWLERHDWQAFIEYENLLHSSIADKPIALLCTYPFSVSKSGDIFDVVRAHPVTIAKRGREWAVIEAPLSDKDADAADAANRILALSRRERQVLEAVAGGVPGKVIAYISASVLAPWKLTALACCGGSAFAPWRRRSGS